MNLIVSLDSYSWINACTGRIIEAPAKFQVLIVCKDYRPILYCPNLCDDAIYAQRSNDLFTLGKELGIKKISNLGHLQDDIDLKKLATQLHLSLMFGGIKTVIYQFNNSLDVMLRSFKDINKLTYGAKVDGELEVFELDNLAWNKKAYLQELMIGINSITELPDLKRAEILIKRK